MIYINSLSTAFVLIPKNASNSIRNSLNGYDVTRVKIAENDHITIQEVVDSNLIHPTTRFIAIIRNPLERQLSLYLYRQRQNRYNTLLSISDFRSRIRTGVIFDHPWQMRLQSSFGTLAGNNVAEWWLYEEVNEKFTEFGTLSSMNKSLNSYSTSSLVKYFYNSDTIAAVEKYWADDFELYERVKDENRTRGH